MILDDYIHLLQKIRLEHGGNIRVTRPMVGKIFDAPPPVIKFTASKKPRETTTRYLETYHDDREPVEKVVKI